MKTKILIAVLAIGLFTTSKAFAQEKEQAKMKQDHSKMEMKMDSTKMVMKHDLMKMDSTKMGMNQDKMVKTYVCPMHPEVTSDKPGECPKCGMTMVAKKMDHSKMDMKHDSMKMKIDSTKMGMNQDKMVKTYVCPMHPEVTSANPGECPKCGMTMVAKKMDHSKMDMKKAEDIPKNKSDHK